MARSTFQIASGMLPKEHYVAVAQVASNWAAFEQIVNSALWYLAKVDDEPGACLTAQIGNIGRSLDALAALAAFRGITDAVIKKINRFASDTRIIGLRRNRVVHDPWAAEKHSLIPHRLEISAQKRLVFDYKPVPTEEVDTLVRDISSHITKFTKIMDAVVAEVGTSLEKPS